MIQIKRPQHPRKIRAKVRIPVSLIGFFSFILGGYVLKGSSFDHYDFLNTYTGTESFHFFMTGVGALGLFVGAVCLMIWGFEKIMKSRFVKIEVIEE